MAAAMSRPGPVILITGADQPVGMARARQLTTDGTHLALQYSSITSQAQVQLLAEELRRRGRNVSISLHPGDLTTLGAVDHLFDQVVKFHHGLDYVVNTTGAVVPHRAQPPVDPDHQLLRYGVFVDEQRRLTMQQFQARLAQDEVL